MKLHLILIGALIPAIATASRFDLPNSIVSNLAPTQDTLRITGNTTIASSGSLSIGPGQVLRIETGALVTVLGGLKIRGSLTDSVRIEPQSAYWNGFVVPGYESNMGTDSIIFEYAAVRGARAIALQVIDYDRVRISHSRFYQNKNTQGVGAPQGAALRVINSSFSVNHSRFESNRDSTTGSKGAGIYWSQGVAKISHSIFERDSASMGAAIYADLLDSLFIDHCQFSSQELATSGRGYGGSLYTTKGRTWIRNSRFSYGNTAISWDYLRAMAIYDTASILLHMSQDTINGYRGLSTTAPVYVKSDSASVTIENSVFFDNQVNPTTNLSGGSLNISAKDILISGVLAYHNSADQGAFASVVAYRSCTMTHSTIANNSAGSFAALYVPTGRGSVAPELFGNIFWGNTPSANPAAGTGFLNIQPGTNVLDPVFVDTSASNFRLSQNSPYIDGGYAIAKGLTALDLDGNPRSVYQSPDPGAYEYQGARPNKLMGNFSRDTILAKGNYHVNETCIRVLDGVQLRIEAGSNFDFNGTCLEVYGSLNIAGTKQEPVVMTSTSLAGWRGVKLYAKSWPTLSNSDSSSIQFLNISKSSGYSIDQYANAKASFYGSHFVGENGVGLLNLQAQAQSWVDSCQFSGLGSGINSSAILKSKGGFTQDQGSAFFISENAVLENWNFNKSKIQLGGSVTLKNSILNASPITTSANPLTLINVLSYGCSGDTAAILQQYGHIKVYHSTLVDHAYYAISAQGGSLDLRNSIVWGNYGGMGIPQLNLGASLSSTIRNNMIQNGWPGDSNLDSDPLFNSAITHDYTLQGSSPALNAGDSTGMISLMSPLDLAGLPRFRGSAMDLGAYEIQTGSIQSPWIENPVYRLRQRQYLNIKLKPQFDLLGRKLQL